MVSVRKLPSGAFQARLMINGITYANTFDSLDDAKDWILLTRAAALTKRLPTRITVREYAARWMTTYDEAPSSTRKWHQGNLDRYILPVIGQRRLSDVNPTDISRMLNGIRARISAAAADSAYRTASVLFNCAVADDLAMRSPVRSKRHRPRRQKEPPAFLERHEARAVLMQLQGWHRDTALIQVSLGARFGEIAGLTPHDVDLARGCITIRRRFYEGTVRSTKNHRLRTLELPAITIPTIERLIREAGDVEPIPPLGDRELDAEPFRRRWLIQTSTGRPPHNSAFDKALRIACEGAGVRRISSHALRHTYVSWMIDEGHSADKIAFWIGDTPATVRMVYSHMLEASSEPAAATIDQALGGFA
jgi:integrase